MPALRTCAAAALAGAAAACSPALNWREVRPEGTTASLVLPCRPDKQARSIDLAGRSVRLVLQACSAGGRTWAVGVADLGDPAQVAPALAELRRAAAANVGAAEGRVLPMTVAGATPNRESARLAFSGRLPDGTAVREQVAVFTRGTLVFQATVLGETLPEEDTETFFASLRAGS